MDDARYAELEREARTIGTEHGMAAGSWVVDGNTPVELLKSLRQWIEDAELFDNLGSLTSPLSGEWADAYSVDQLARDVGLVEDEDAEPDEDADGPVLDDLATAYEDAYWSAYETQVAADVVGFLGDEVNTDGE